MISVCIPVYNTYVNVLVEELVLQFKNINTAFEILVLDDGSEKAYQLENRLLISLPNVYYNELQSNKGRIAARNQLAGWARFDWLLFIDADSKILSSDFVSNYLFTCTNAFDVIVGGRIYRITQPEQCNQVLHWKYGRQREANTNGRFIFMTNNFCIRKSIFQQLYFPDSLQGYGHEDTWMGIQLQKQKARICFIKNPILHDGLERAEVFIKKSKNALKNLMVLQQLVDEQTLQQHVRLFKVYCRLKKIGLPFVFFKIETILNPFILKNLTSCSATLWLFDIYRMAYFIRLQKKKNYFKIDL